MAGNSDQKTAHVEASPWLGALAILLVTTIAYLPAVRGDFIWDDDDYVSQNPTLNDLSGLGQIWFKIGATRQYYPLAYTTFWIEKHLWGLAPAGYHIVNILLHGLGACLLWRVLRRLRVPGALLAACIFALHPVHVESVAWITERKNVLSGVFYFAAALLYLRFEERNSEKSSAKPGDYRLYAASLFLFLCAILSKSVTCSLPAALLLIHWWKNGRVTLREIQRLAPYFVTGIALAVTTAWMENTHVGAGGPEWHRTFSVRLITAGNAFWFYLGKLFWPHPLIFIYEKWRIDPTAAVQYLSSMAAMILLLVLFILRRRIGRGPTTAACFFAGTLLPALGFFNVFYAIRYAPVADHFQYLASVGPIALFAAGLSRAFAGPGHSSARLIAVGAAIGLPLGILTWTQCSAYRDIESLWTDTLRKNPNAAIAHLNLGSIRLKQGSNAEAERCFRRAMELDIPTATVHFNLGTALLNLNRTDEAILELQAALQLQPDYPKCLVNLGNAFITRGRSADALSPLNRAIELKPDYALAHQNLASALDQLGRYPEAEQHYREAGRLNPTDKASRDRADALRAALQNKK